MAFLTVPHAVVGDEWTCAQRWTHILPPRHREILALLQANPQLDLLFCAHTGLEGSSDFHSLINGSWVNSMLKVHFWRVPLSDIPDDLDSQRNFVVQSWDRIQREVSLLHTAELKYQANDESFNWGMGMMNLVPFPAYFEPSPQLGFSHSTSRITGFLYREGSKMKIVWIREA